MVGRVTATSFRMLCFVSYLHQQIVGSVLDDAVVFSSISVTRDTQQYRLNAFEIERVEATKRDK